MVLVMKLLLGQLHLKPINNYVDYCSSCFGYLMAPWSDYRSYYWRFHPPSSSHSYNSGFN